MRSTSATRLTLGSLVPRDVFGALEALGIDAEQSGDEAKALCPNPDHHDRSPSWSCNLDTGDHHCFACGFGGSFMFLVGKMLGVTRGGAESWVLARKVKDLSAGYVERAPAEKRAEHMSEADMWKFTDPPGDALASRALTIEACRAYGVRWDTDNDLWITPVRDPKSGQLLGWQEKNARYFNNLPKNLVKSGSLFGWERVPLGGTVLLVESPLDAPYVVPGCPGDVYPVSSYGASVSREQVQLIRSRAGRVILAMDNDEAGWRSVGKLAFAFGTTPVLVFDYGNSVRDATGVIDIAEPDGRDPGNLTMDEISCGIRQALFAWEIRIPWL